MRGLTYKMLDNHISLNNTDYTKNESELLELYNIVSDRLNFTMEIYDYTNEVVLYIQLLLYEVYYTDLVHKTLNLLNKLGLSGV